MPTYGPVSTNETWTAPPGTWTPSSFSSSTLNSQDGTSGFWNTGETNLSWQLVLSRGFSPSVTSGETVDGIQVEYYKWAAEDTANVYWVDSLIQLGKGTFWYNTALVGSSLADGSTHWPTTGTYVSYGGASSLWGTTWTVAEVNSQLATAIRPLGIFSPSPTSTRYAYADHVRVTIYTTTGATGPAMPFNGGAFKFGRAFNGRRAFS